MINNKILQRFVLTFILLFSASFISSLPCENPRDGMIITKDTVFCPGTFKIPNSISVSPKVMLNCNGAVLQGEGRTKSQTGISASSGSQIKNCVIKGYRYGIYSGGAYNLFIGNTFEDNYHGIHLQESFKSTIKSNKFEDNYDIGVYGYNSREIQILTNTFYSNGKGIYLDWTVGSNIWGNTIKSSDAGGIYVSGQSNNIVNNILSGNGYNWQQGAGIVSHQNNSISFNSITNNYVGLYLPKTYPTYLFKNTLKNNGKDVVINPYNERP